METLFELNQRQIAGVILEPMNYEYPKDNFLQKVKQLCERNGTVLIFDEVITGFRFAKGGAQELFGVTPDLTTLGKIIGGGFPVGAYGGRKEIMDSISPTGPVYQAGTLSGNPIAMNAGYAQLKYLNEHPETYQELDNTRIITVLSNKRYICPW